MKSGYGVAGLVGESSIPSGKYNASAKPGQVEFDNCYFAGSVNSSNPISTDMIRDEVSRVVVKNGLYYAAGSYTGTANSVGTEYAADKFADGTVAGLLGDGWATYDGVPVYGAAPTFDLGGDLDFDPAVKEYAVTTEGEFKLNVTTGTDGAKVIVSADNAEKLSANGNSYTVTTAEGDVVNLTVTVKKGKLVTVYTVKVTHSVVVPAGSGSATDPFLISNADELAWMSNPKKADGTALSYLETYYYELTADIDLGGKAWTPIGNNSNRFQGHFDGKDHTITGLNINVDGNYVGFFGGAQKATIANLKIANANVTGNQRVGGIIGTTWDKVTLTDCSFSGTITGTVVSKSDDAAHVGGLVGGVEAGTLTIDNCDTDVTIAAYRGTLTWNHMGIGGLVGGASSGSNLTVDIKDSSAVVDIVCTQAKDSTAVAGMGVAGIMGYVRNSSGSSTGTVKVKMQNCYSSGTISAAADTAGLLGFLRTPGNTAGGKVEAEIIGCYSTVTAPNGRTINAGLSQNYNTQDNLSLITVKIEDSYFAGKAAISLLRTQGTTGTINLTMDNVYYLTGTNSFTPDNNGETIAISNVAQKSVAEFADGTVSDLLGEGWGTSTKGYPVHSDVHITKDNMVMVGTSIRTYGTKGMRFYFKMNVEANNDPKALGLKEYGVVVAKADNVTETGLLFDSAKSGKMLAFDGTTTKHVREDNTDDPNATYDYFTALLTFNSATNIETKYNGRAYALYVDSKGQEIVVYSDTIDGTDGTYNSLMAVAEKALDEMPYDGYYSDAEEDYLNSIVAQKKTTTELG